MRIEHLREFVDLASTLSYSETARRMLVSESALSRHIRSLEEELASALFERTSRRVRLADAGEQLLPFAEAIGRTWAEYEAERRARRARSRSAVDIGSNYYIGDAIGAFLADAPEVAVRQVSQGESNEALLAKLEHGECQFVVLTDPPELDAHITSATIAEDSFVAVLPSRHRLASSPSIRPAQLEDEHFISFQTGTIGDGWVREICRRSGFEPNVIFSSEVGSSLARLVGEGLGVTFLQKRAISKMPTHDIALVDLSPPVDFTVQLCWDRRTTLSESARAFRSALLRTAGPDR